MFEALALITAIFAVVLLIWGGGALLDEIDSYFDIPSSQRSHRQ
jgi:hypothetical protein